PIIIPQTQSTLFPYTTLFRSALEKERQTLEKLDATIDEWQTELVTATQKLEQFEGKKQVLNERTKHFAENKEKLTAQQKETASRDRKSTRLNSSHVSISYAVF